MRLSTKLYTTFILIGIIPALILGIVIYRISTGVQQSLTDTAIHAYQGGTNALIAKDVTRLSSIADVLVNDPGIETALIEKNTAYLDKLLAGVGKLDYIVFTDSEGALVASAFGQGLTQVLTERRSPSTRRRRAWCGQLSPFPAQSTSKGASKSKATAEEWWATCS
jgi:hypothetical protein